MRRRRLANATDLIRKGEGRTGPGSTGCQSSAPFPPRAEYASWAWTRTHWTDADMTALRAACDSKIAIEAAADHLGRSPKSIAWRARDHGILIPAEWRNIIAPRKLIHSGRPELLAYPYIITRRTEHDALLKINAMVPAALPEWLRADVCQNIMLAVLEGGAQLDAMNFASVAAFIRRTRKENGDFRTISLDAPVGDTDLRLIDTIADDPERIWDDTAFIQT